MRHGRGHQFAHTPLKTSAEKSPFAKHESDYSVVVDDDDDDFVVVTSETVFMEYWGHYCSLIHSPTLK